VSDLPGIGDLKAAGLLDGRVPPDFDVPSPNDAPALRSDEDPLEEDAALDLLTPLDPDAEG
jgi:segregation and condensation protein B